MKPAPKKICLLELWGLGDAVMMTPMLQALRAAGLPTTVVCKPVTIRLLQPSFPEVEYLPFDPPWSVFQGKYRLWRWPWGRLFALVWQLFHRHFDVAISVRRDPRDHFLMGLIGARRRMGFPRAESRFFLTEILPEPAPARPVAEDWMALAARLLPGSPSFPPHLEARAYAPPPDVSRPSRTVIGLHTGARIPVRRWDLENFRELIQKLRECFDFDFVLMPDIDGYGSALGPLADRTLASLSLEQMVGALAACDVLICNDSAPGHIADALGVPVVTIFGPTHPSKFRPYSDRALVVIRDLCPYRPCLDYCRFPTPHCLTGLTVGDILPEILTHLRGLIERGELPAALLRAKVG